LLQVLDHGVAAGMPAVCLTLLRLQMHYNNSTAASIERRNGVRGGAIMLVCNMRMRTTMPYILKQLAVAAIKAQSKTSGADVNAISFLLS
jgi:hypothetical protein